MRKVVGMMGPQNRKKQPEEIVYRELKDAEIANYRTQYLRLPPTQFIRDKIKAGVASGIPMEFFVDTKVITENNLFELDFESDMLKKFMDYIQYKSGGEAFQIPDLLTEVPEETQEENSNESNENSNESTEETVEETIEESTEEVFEYSQIEIDNKPVEVQHYSQENIDEIKEELEKTYNIQIESLERSHKNVIKELTNRLQEKDDKLKSLEERLESQNTLNTQNLSRLVELRKELVDLRTEISELNGKIAQLNKIKMSYDLIKDDYVKYKEHYIHSSAETEELVRNYEQNIEGLKETITRIRKERDDIQEVFNEFYNSEGITDNHSSSTKAKTFYFRVIGVPAYFCTMLAGLESMIETKELKIIQIVFKHESNHDDKLFPGFGNLKDIHTIEDVKTVNSKIITGHMDRVMATKLDAFLDDYDVAIVLDYIVDGQTYINSPIIEKIDVVKNKKQYNLLDMDETNVVSEDHHDIIDISHDARMEKYSNPRVKANFYRGRLNEWVTSVLNKEIDL